MLVGKDIKNPPDCCCYPWWVVEEDKGIMGHESGIISPIPVASTLLAWQWGE